ncbi:hypothetical protein ACJRO7_018263 [Eucalyptus globulus]|uniref:DUF7890 domain-containing protein n=1 Tax=Eucalyptus globulus TaxID=34317 RepID=A0ABD3KXD0_EUCGL
MALFLNKNGPVLPFFTSCLDTRSPGEHGYGAAEKRAKSASPVYRDELSKVKRKTGRREIALDAEKSRFCGDPIDGEKGLVMRVKVKMTKQEAARLLSKCGDGGVLEFRDVARELVKLPMSRVSVVSRTRPEDGAVAELKSIPEEDEERM